MDTKPVFSLYWGYHVFIDTIPNLISSESWWLEGNLLPLAAPSEDTMSKAGHTLDIKVSQTCRFQDCLMISYVWGPRDYPPDGRCQGKERSDMLDFNIPDPLIPQEISRCQICRTVAYSLFMHARPSVHIYGGCRRKSWQLNECLTSSYLKCMASFSDRVDD